MVRAVKIIALGIAYGTALGEVKTHEQNCILGVLPEGEPFD